MELYATPLAFVPHIGFHQRFDLILVHAGLDLFHREDVSLSGDRRGGLHMFRFLWRFVKSHLAQDDRGIDDRVRRIRGLQAANALAR